MPIWSFTQERLDRLKDQIAKKKAEYDHLKSLSELDLWCKDLDEFEAEWENQLRLDAEITTGIRRMGRRVSKKIGAGGGGAGRGRKPKGDDEYAPTKPKTASKAAAKPKEPPKEKSVQRFAAMFNSNPKPKKETDDTNNSDSFSDDDFAKLKNPVKKAKPVSDDEDESVLPNPRSKRAAATKAKTWVVDEDSESDDDKMLGDVGDLVKGITSGSGGASENKTGRLSLFSMSRPESSSGNSTGLQVKSKPSKPIDLDDHDDTNYEMLAKSSPHKNARGDELDSFLSDDDDMPPVSKVVRRSKPQAAASEDPKPKPAATAAVSSAGGAAVKKARGRPAGAKNKDKEDAPAKKAAAPKAKAKTTKAKAVQLSPAAKAYAAKKAKKDAFDMDDDEDDDIEMAEPDSPPPRPAARGRPGRAATAKSKPVYVIDDDSDEDDFEDAPPVANDDSDGQSDDFAMDDSE